MHATAGRYGDVNLIADPLYGYIEITKGHNGAPGEQHLLDTRWLRRLRRIHQLQSAWWVFPTAEHSRFSHLLGAMHLATTFARQIDGSLRASVPDTPSSALVESTLRLAGLLHDVGHGPFGHFFDRTVLARDRLDHEDVGRRIVIEELGDLIAALEAAPRGPFSPGERVDPRAVAWVMAPGDVAGYDPPAWLRACKPLLCGPATVDNLDYVVRDAYMCGVGVGAVDVRRLRHYTFVADGTTVLHAHGVGALQMFLQARLFLYTNIYFHRTVRRIDLTMREAFPESIDYLCPDGVLATLDTYATLTDWSLLESVERWRRAPANQSERHLGQSWEPVVSRNLPWHLAHETTLRGDADTSTLEADIRTAVAGRVGSANVEVDIAVASVAPRNGLDVDGMVAIYDPLVDRVERSQTAELIARLPQHNQIVRVFTDDTSAVNELGRVVRAMLTASIASS